MSCIELPRTYLFVLAGCAGSAIGTTNTTSDTVDSGTAAETGCATTATPITPAIDVTSSMTGQESGRAGYTLAFLGDGRLAVGAPSVPHMADEIGVFSDDQVYVTEGGEGALPHEVAAITVDDNTDEFDPSTSVNRNGFGTGVFAPGDVTGDGIDDLAVADSPEVDHGAGRWTIVPGPGFECPVLLGEWSTSARAATCGDVDGDRRSDLCTTEGVVFGPIAEMALPGISWVMDERRRVTATDSDGDGVRELVVSDPGTEALHRLTPSRLGAVSLASVATATWTATGGTVTPFENFHFPPKDDQRDGYAEHGRVRVMSGAGLP